MSLKIKNWDRFQHYKTRKPPWIKLYRDLLEDMQWFRLQGASKALLIELWIIASEGKGCLPPIDVISFRLRKPEKEIKALISTLSHWLEDDASELLAERKQDAMPETERETEKDKEREEDKDICPIPENLETGPIKSKSKTVLVFPVKGKTKDWNLTSEVLIGLEEAFPGIDVLSECNRALVWTKLNPVKQKTSRGMGKFLFGWIERSNNGGFKTNGRSNFSQGGDETSGKYDGLVEKVSV